MASKEVVEPHIIFIYDTPDEELEDTACSILKNQMLIDAPAKRKFSPYEFFVKKTACSCNKEEIIWNKLESNNSRENDEEDDPWPSPTPKRRKRLTAHAYFAILMGKESWTKTSDNSVQSSIGSTKPEMSESDENFNVFKIKKKRLTAPAYRKFLRECNMRAKILREFNKTNNPILMSDA
ncbi:uncharacterized protein LOC110036151 isoform X2 [Phalaenopsis equestris]|uniref:uncharacterized protein LOC110036151 isoform X2 n=1 Tax=Phalaenopsis equestris TaxID=78828 RepID=UPI0009E48003|nr:uncharacterized protein LOC110036151 isoform X2 [Phalaenopsis equestris]